MHDAQVSQLRDRFVRLARTPETQTIFVGWFEVLAGLYGSAGRYYHTLDHVAELLARLDVSEAAGIPGYRLDVEFAIWFHDAIYDVKSKTNEADSAALARACLQTIGIVEASTYPNESNFCKRVLGAIEATKHLGDDLNGHHTAKVMVDLDLAGFADPWDVFDGKNRAIRKEYAIYTDEQYRWGRTRFMSGLLTRPKIYYLHGQWEKPARVNIERHIRELVSA